MSRKELRGVFALIPLVLKENQEIDYEGMKENIRFLADAGIHGFIALGCMGQCHAVNDREFEKVVDAGISASDKIASVFGTTNASTNECVRRTKYAEDAGADGVMIAPPYALPLTYDECFEHYLLVNDSVDDLQIMAYNYPYLPRGLDMNFQFWKERLLGLDSIKALKESTLSHDKLIFTIKDRINVFSGSENNFFHDSIIGAKGIVSEFSLVAPKLVLEFYDACLAGEQRNERMLRIYERILDCFYAVPGGLEGGSFSIYEIAYMNATAEIGGHKAGPPRHPYQVLPKEMRSRLEKAIQDLAATERG